MNIIGVSSAFGVETPSFRIAEDLDGSFSKLPTFFWTLESSVPDVLPRHILTSCHVTADVTLMSYISLSGRKNNPVDLREEALMQHLVFGVDRSEVCLSMHSKLGEEPEFLVLSPSLGPAR